MQTIKTVPLPYGWDLAGGGILLSLAARQDRRLCPPSLISIMGSFSGCEVAHSPPSGVEVKNVWNCDSTALCALVGDERETERLKRNSK
jgi:hypothetical protein